MSSASSRRKFGSRSTALEVTEGVDLSGRVALVTGTTSGIGIETARALALRGAHLLMANRNAELSRKLRDDILSEKPDAKIDFISIDLSSLKSVQSAAKEFLSKNLPLHILILNAGIFAPSFRSTTDGFEPSFGVNHLGHFYLTTLLLDRIRESSPARVVVVSSHSHCHTGIDSEMPLEKKLELLIPDVDSSRTGYRRYAYSKMCNLLMAFKLHRMEHGNGIHVYAVHPGTMIATGISRSYGIWARFAALLTRPMTKTLEQGAATSVYCATYDDLNDESGKYFESCDVDEKHLSGELANDEELQDALWLRSALLIERFESSK